MAVTMSQALAEHLADVARLLADPDSHHTDQVLHRLTALGVELVPGAVAAAATISGCDRAWTFAASDRRINELHDLQFDSGDGPVVETIRHSEPRRVDDMAAEHRWPAFCPVARRAGFTSCLALPLRTDSQPGGAVIFYGERPHVFQGAAFDIALLFSALGGAAIHNVSTYHACRELTDNLQTALESRAMIEQAKGILRAELGVTPQAAFELLSRASQHANIKVRDLSAALVQGRLSAESLQRSGHPRQARRPAGPASRYARPADGLATAAAATTLPDGSPDDSAAPTSPSKPYTRPP